jgi:hypothetical protein
LFNSAAKVHRSLDGRREGHLAHIMFIAHIRFLKYLPTGLASVPLALFAQASLAEGLLTSRVPAPSVSRAPIQQSIQQSIEKKVDGVPSTDASNARYVRCYGKKYELFLDLSKCDLKHGQLEDIQFGIRKGEGPFTKDHALTQFIRGSSRKVIHIMGSTGVRIELGTNDYLVGDAVLHDWDLACDFLQNNIYAQDPDWNRP